MRCDRLRRHCAPTRSRANGTRRTEKRWCPSIAIETRFSTTWPACCECCDSIFTIEVRRMGCRRSLEKKKQPIWIGYFDSFILENKMCSLASQSFVYSRIRREFSETTVGILGLLQGDENLTFNVQTDCLIKRPVLKIFLSQSINFLMSPFVHLSTWVLAGKISFTKSTPSVRQTDQSPSVPNLSKDFSRLKRLQICQIKSILKYYRNA